MNAVDDRLRIESSLLVDRSPGLPSAVSVGPAFIGPRLGEDALVVG